MPAQDAARGDAEQAAQCKAQQYAPGNELAPPPGPDKTRAALPLAFAEPIHIDGKRSVCQRAGAMPGKAPS